MKTKCTKVFVDQTTQSTSDKENFGSATRKSLKTLQPAADKENLAGRVLAKEKIRLTDDEMNDLNVGKKTKPSFFDKSVQTEDTLKTVAASDLTGEPSEAYWQTLAEKRRLALEEALSENQTLHEENEQLKEQNKSYKEMLDETKNLVQVLTEMLEEKDAEDENAPGDGHTEADTN